LFRFGFFFLKFFNCFVAWVLRFALPSCVFFFFFFLDRRLASIYYYFLRFSKFRFDLVCFVENFVNALVQCFITIQPQYTGTKNFTISEGLTINHFRKQ